MEIIRQHANGQVLVAKKEYDELTEEELSRLVIPSGTTKEDYKNYRVDHNKKGKLIKVIVEDYSEKFLKQLHGGVDFVDAMQVVYGNKKSKEHKKAKDRVSKQLSIKDEDIDLEKEKVANLEHIEKILESDMTAYRIAELTGISRTTISKYRNGSADIMNMTFANAIKLTNLYQYMYDGAFYEF